MQLSSSCLVIASMPGNQIFSRSLRYIGRVNEELQEERDDENGEGGPGYQIHAVHHGFYKKLEDRWS